jgi:diguanylate cyclase (GGDEF)-like protein
MNSAVSTFNGQTAEAPLAATGGVPSAVLKRRAIQRRQMLAAQTASYVLGASVLLFYFHAGSIPIIVPAAFFLSGITVIGFFAVLSETYYGDRYRDHHLTIYQVAAHIMVQLAFVMAAPNVGYAFLNVLFLIFGVGALGMTARQAVIAWSLTALGAGPIFLFSKVPIGMPMATPAERFAATLCFVLTIGQCAFVGLHGNSLRRMLYERGVQLKEAYKRIEELAELDELTGSFNRRCIMRMLDDEIARAHRGKTPFSVALIDLDWFKRINDAYGHPTGDEVLRTFAITVFANIRSIDRFGRYGGEEFLLILPDTPHDTAWRILERQREIIAELDWSAFSPGMSVTISAGVATLTPNEAPDALLARADSALYAAKARGRNRIASA